MKKPAFEFVKNKGADQVRSNWAANQHICLRNINSTIPLFPKSKNLSL